MDIPWLRFCARVEMRLGTRAPWVAKDGQSRVWRCATDCRIVIRAPDAGPVTAHGRQPWAQSIVLFERNQVGDRPVIDCPVHSGERFEEPCCICRGTGYGWDDGLDVEGDYLDVTKACGWCDGACRALAPVTIGDQLFNGRWIALMNLLPAVKVAPNWGEALKDKPLAFVFGERGEGQGLLMPTTPQ